MSAHKPFVAHAATLADLVAAAAAHLNAAQLHYGHGTSDAAQEARWLVLWALGLPIDTPLNEAEAAEDAQAQLSSSEHAEMPFEADSSKSHFGPRSALCSHQGTRPISAQERQRVQQLIDERVASRKPAAYLTREAWLMGVPFYVDERAIVPRSFIAELIADGGFDEWLSDQTQRVLDLCTGNGSLACLAAMAWPEVRITASDISADALAVACINVERHDLSERIQLVQTDGLRGLDGPWDLILCNPPYVNAASMAALPAEYRAEPALALGGGADGMDFIRTLLRDATRVLSDEGVLVLEIGNEREHFEAAFPTLPVQWLPTSAGEDAVLLIVATALRWWAQTQHTQPPT